MKNVHLQVKAYTDVDWVGNLVDKRSTTGHISLLGGNLII